jgi:hypothetical protein
MNPSKSKKAAAPKSGFSPRLSIAQAAKFYRVSPSKMRRALLEAKIEAGADARVTHSQAWAALAVHRMGRA